MTTGDRFWLLLTGLSAGLALIGVLGAWGVERVSMRVWVVLFLLSLLSIMVQVFAPRSTTEPRPPKTDWVKEALQEEGRWWVERQLAKQGYPLEQEGQR